MGPIMNCVRNAGNLKAEKCCFFARLFENNHATLFKKTLVYYELIKFNRIVISILYLIIFIYAKKIMKTVILIRWILYVMEL